MITDGIEMIIVVVWKKVAIARAHPGQIHVVRPDDERHEAEEQRRIDHGPVAPERLARVVRDDLGDDAHRRQDQHIHLRVARNQNRCCHSSGLPPPLTCASCPPIARPVGRKKLVPGHPVHQLHDPRRLERRERQQQQKRGRELRPHEKRQPHPGQPRRAQLDDRGDEVDRAQQRRGDQEHHRRSARTSVRRSESTSPAANTRSSPPGPRRPE